MRTFDYSQIQSRQWDSEILGLVAQIHEFKGRQELYLKQKPAVLDKLIDIAKVQSTEASNKIEGIVTTNTRVQQLCMEKTTPRNRDEEEIIQKVIRNIFHFHLCHTFLFTTNSWNRNPYILIQLSCNSIS